VLRSTPPPACRTCSSAHHAKLLADFFIRVGEQLGRKSEFSLETSCDLMLSRETPTTIVFGLAEVGI